MNRPLVHSGLEDIIRDAALTQFTRMEKTGDFGPAGRDRAMQHFARVFLGLPPHAPLLNGATRKFWDDIRKKQEKLGLSTLGKEELKQKEKEAAVEIDGKSVNLDEPDEINAALKKEGSALRLVSGWTGPFRCLILAESKEEMRNGFTMITLEKEIARTPTAIFPMAAMAGGTQVAIRSEAIANIAWTKWGMGPSRWFDSGRTTDIRELLKNATLKLYGIENADDYAAKEKIVVDELVETTLFHELAHAVILNHELTEAETKTLEELEPTDGTPLSILNEALAEWLPRRGELQGPLLHMADLAEKGDVRKATRLFYRYLSDSWFYGNPEEAYLTAQTDVIVGSMVNFLNADGSVDFAALKKSCEEIFRADLAILKKQLESPADTAAHLNALSTLKADRAAMTERISSALK